MLNFFGTKKQNSRKEINDILSGILEKGKFALSFQVIEKESDIFIDIFGEDEGLLKTKEGRLLLALQTYCLCILKKKFPDFNQRLIVDSNGFWEEKQKRLLSLAENLAEKAVKTNRPVILKRALAPNERRLVHEKFSQDQRVKSLSFGEGFYKNIKFVPNRFKK